MQRQIDFIGMRKTWFAISALLIAIGLVSLVMPGRGLRLGIDFTGGILADLTFDKAISTGEVRDALNSVNLGGAQIQKTTDAANEVLIRTRSLTAEEQRAMNSALESKVGKFQILRLEEVKGVIGQELARKGVLALLLAGVGMIAYITVRFEYKFALTGMAALVHDVFLVIGFYSLTGLEANSPLIAVVLTIIGYSINDTIVVFDRIRENLKSRRRESLKDIVNASINQTMTRSLNTSLTTLLAVLAVFLFGGRTTRDFALALLVGITTGTYSSIFVASPLWWMWKVAEERAAQGLGASTAATAVAAATAVTAYAAPVEVPRGAGRVAVEVPRGAGRRPRKKR